MIYYWLLTIGLYPRRSRRQKMLKNVKILQNLSKSYSFMSILVKKTQKTAFLSGSSEKTNPISVLPPGPPRARRKRVHSQDIFERQFQSSQRSPRAPRLYNREKRTQSPACGRKLEALNSKSETMRFSKRTQFEKGEYDVNTYTTRYYEICVHRELPKTKPISHRGR